MFHSGSGLRFRRSFHSRGLSGGLGGLRPINRAAGAALRLIELILVRVYSRANHNDFFLLSSIP